MINPVSRDRPETTPKGPISWFVLAGQSNMAGFGSIQDIEELGNERIFVWRNGTSHRAIEPLHSEHERNGIGLGMSFAVEVLSTIEGPVGLIPTAISGSPLSLWQPGKELFDRAIQRIKAASEVGSVKGILWHQGETDAMDENTARSYKDGFLITVDGFRDFLQNPRLPFISGELGEFLSRESDCLYYEIVNRALRDVQSERQNYSLVSAKGLHDDGDTVHFDARSLREFGRRYARAWIRMHSGERLE